MSHHRLSLLPVAVLIAACTAGSPTSSSAPATGLTSLVSLSNLGGSWLYNQPTAPGDTAVPNPSEAAAGALAFCAGRHLYAWHWALTQFGDQVTGTVVYDSPGGVMQNFGLTETVTGTLTGNSLILNGTYTPNVFPPTTTAPTPTPVTYYLTYNAQTQHLVGSRNGKPYWSAPFVMPDDPNAPASARDCGLPVP